MKKLLCILLVSVLFVSTASATGIDLSSMSFDELIALRMQIDSAIWNSQEWQEVEVPEGTYLIGQDIPAGKWTISCSEKYYVDLEVGTKLLPNMNIDWVNDLDNYMHATLMGKSYVLYNEGDSTFVSWELKEGQYICISHGSAYFTPFTGLGFFFK